MLLDASHRRWVVGALVVLLVATAAYVPYARGAMQGPSGGSWPRLIYGGGGVGPPGLFRPLLAPAPGAAPGHRRAPTPDVGEPLARSPRTLVYAVPPGPPR